LKPPSRDNRHEVPYPRAQQRNATKVGVKPRSCDRDFWRRKTGACTFSVTLSTV